MRYEPLLSLCVTVSASYFASAQDVLVCTSVHACLLSRCVHVGTGLTVRSTIAAFVRVISRITYFACVCL